VNTSREPQFLDRPGFGPLPGGRRRPVELSRAQSRVLTALEDVGEPVSLAGLSEATGLHPNTLRDHLDTLISSGLVQRHQALPSGPGRPRTLYEPAPDDTTGGSAEYAGLARALASSIHRTSSDPRREATEAGERWGHDLAGGRSAGRAGSTSGGAGARREVVALLDEIGFAPTSDRHSSVVHLTRCPLLDAAREYPDVVCAVHLGIARGALAEYGADPAPAELFPFSEPGACRLHLGGPR
jgi:predicted ArsR family transcriptional regulator